MEEAYDLYESLGIHAIKSGYVADSGMKDPEGQHHHGQYMVNHYYNAVKRAAEHKIMINTHEPIKGTGLYRTYPNWLAREGVSGMEYNAWSAGNPPEHTTILPFTRMMACPIDYTPGIFNVEIDEQPNYRVHTTRAKQLALYVTISSPLQMVTDLPENYIDANGNLLPEFKFIKDIPITWDDIMVPHAEIGDYVTIVRQSGEEWYIGSITDEVARDLEVSLDFLDEDKQYVAEIYSDDHDVDWVTNPDPVTINKVIVSHEDTLLASLATSGGQAVRLYPASFDEINTLEHYSKPIIDLSYNQVPSSIGSNDEFDILIDVTNNGSVVAKKELELYIDDQLIESIAVRVKPNHTETIKWTFSNFFEPTNHSIKVNDLKEKIVTVNEKAPTFTYSNIHINQNHDTVTAKATVTNYGTFEGVCTVELIINGVVIETKDVSLDSNLGGVSTEVSFTYQLPSEGVYEIALGDIGPKVVSYPSIDLNGEWLFNKGDDPTYKNLDFDDENWQVVTLPSSWEHHSDYHEDNVFGWYRKTIVIPESWQGYSLKLTLGKIDDADETFFNGLLIGRSGQIPNEENGYIMETAWQKTREYIVPASEINYGSENIISIRAYDATVGGGMYDGPLKYIELIKPIE